MPTPSPASVPGIHQYGIHSDRPAATAVAEGAEWACLTLGTIYQSDGATWTTKFSSTTRTTSIEFVIDGGGAVIPTGVKGDIELPFSGTITAVRMFADVSGSIVVDIWKDTYSNHPPTGADSITASAKPTISSATKSQNSTLTGWTTSFSAGDILRYNVDSATTVTRVTVALTVTVS
jgi:hypothetical protein